MIQLDTLCLGCMSLKDPDPVCKACGWDAAMPHESSLYLPPGTVLIDRYLLGRVLGHGGFGITYLGLELNLNMRLAVKEYLPSGMATRVLNDPHVSVYHDEAEEHFEKGLSRFEEEAQAVAQFEGHPGIVSVRDFFHANGTAYMVMHYMDGITLKEHLQQRGGRLTYQETLKIMKQVMDTLGSVHQTNLLHRDISPGNIYITKEGQVKLLDFGAARYAIGQYTRSLSVILKEGYAPPEQYHSRGKQGPWTDIYATAATFYEAVTGQTPPQALDRREEETIVPPRQLASDVPKKANVALLKALSLHSEDRYQTIQDFQQALGEDPTPPPILGPPAPPRRARRWLTAVAGLLMVVLTLVAFGWYTQTRPAAQPPPPPGGAESTLTETRVLLSTPGALSANDLLFVNRYQGVHAYYDTYDINIPEPTNLVVTLQSSEYDTYLIVRSPAGDEQTKDDVGTRNTNSKLDLAATQTGTWKIIVTSNTEKATGRYFLEVVRSSQ